LCEPDKLLLYYLKCLLSL